MKYRLGKTSLSRLETCHPDLIGFVKFAISDSPIDFTVVCGNRCESDQEKAFKNGFSKAHFGESPHNFEPSLAVDLSPYVDGKLVWDDNVGHYTTLINHLYQVERQLHSDGAITNHIEQIGSWDKPHWQLRGWKNLIVLK